MAWLIGIDEAGYGPNLGPFVMSSVAWRVTDALVGANLWEVLHDAVRRAGEDGDERIIVDDSKAVHGSPGGLATLETNTIAALSPWKAGEQPTLAGYVERFSPTSRDGLAGEAWYAGTTVLPLSPPDGVAERSQRLRVHCAGAGIEPGPLRSVAVCAPRFNALLDQHTSKGMVLAVALTELMRECCATLPGNDALHFLVDKHGGRNTYAAMLQDAMTEGMVIVRGEGAARSHYEVLGASRPILVTFQPRADVEHFAVALASMASKYLRELFMLEFNRFWRKHVPDVAPTAGYPSDAARFLHAIRPAMRTLGIDETAIWRRK